MKVTSLLKLVGVLSAWTANLQNGHAQGTPGFSPQAVVGGQTSRPFYVTGAPANVDGPYLEFINNSNGLTNRAGSIGYIAGYSSDPANTSHMFYSRTSTGGWISNFRIFQNGKV